jgi:sterol desaturase/sphingolipid hydroxylase (fatty acid hydroxylase superfamily)
MPPVIAPVTIPIAVLFLVIEIIYSYRERKELYAAKDTLSNIGLGVAMFISNIFLKWLGFYFMTWLYQYHLVSLPGTWWIWVLAFLGNDLTFYWYHRACHEINWFWASHVVHHSSEHINISTSFRQSLTTNLTGHFIFWLWMPLLGFTPFMTIIVTQLCVFYQFFLHTETVKTLPWIIEYIFNTPSHHRVHHGSNPEYLDKNHGGILIIWDRLFGTFCEESAKPRYGLTTKLNSTNPVTIVFHVWKETFQKAYQSRSWVMALHYFTKSPGWSHDGKTQTVKQMRGPKPTKKRQARRQSTPLLFGKTKLARV